LKYFLQFSYNGKAYHGWQNQPNAISVQEVLEKAFATLLREKVSLVGAGRTDAGVHAKQMFAHFEIDPIQDVKDLKYKLNAILPEDIAVQEIIHVSKEAHARFDAVSRTYEYWITQRKDPFYKDGAHYVKQDIEIERMNEAALLLLEHDDFECFSKSNTDVYTYLCDITAANWVIEDDLLIFTITANRFLRNMVRAIVGTLLEVGVGKSNIDDVKAIINSKNRSNAGTSVPAKGLYLTQVIYPKSTFLTHG
jgi:tRNA pseudouridine38-40 synthase